MTMPGAAHQPAAARLKVPLSSRAGLGAVLWATLAAPPLQRALTATMTLHMLVQIPLLILAGWLMAGAIATPLRNRLAAWNMGGVSGLLLASVVSTVWMLPRALDAAFDDPWVAFAKFVSVPLLIGTALALSWARMGFVVRGVFFVELIATFFRLGWLYLASPVRLCGNYLMDDQQLLGELLLAAGVAVSLVLAWRLLFGHVALAGFDATDNPAKVRQPTRIDPRRRSIHSPRRSKYK